MIALFKDKTSTFCTAFKNCQQFSVGIKIFPFDNRVVSVHILVLRMEKANLLDDSMDDIDEANMLLETEAGDDRAAKKNQAIKPAGKRNLFSSKKKA